MFIAYAVAMKTTVIPRLGGPAAVKPPEQPSRGVLSYGDIV
jgi:hypothetical protein